MINLQEQPAKLLNSILKLIPCSYNEHEFFLVNLEKMDPVKTANIAIRKMDSKAEIPYQLLLLADPEKRAIDSYIFNSELYIAEYNTKVIGVFVLLPIDNATIELKNIAVDESLQRKGIGKHLINSACQVAAANGYNRFIVGTANSSIDELYFYQKMGFDFYDLKKNFFLENYSLPIIEKGIQARHMLMLEKYL